MRKRFRAPLVVAALAWSVLAAPVGAATAPLPAIKLADLCASRSPELLAQCEGFIKGVLDEDAISPSAAPHYCLALEAIPSVPEIYASYYQANVSTAANAVLTIRTPASAALRSALASKFPC
jgi:hypothetical protein